jgi:hypothetical protein
MPIKVLKIWINLKILILKPHSCFKSMRFIFFIFLMKKYFIYSILACFLLVITLFYSIDFTTSIIPGWITTIYPRWILILISIFLLDF